MYQAKVGMPCCRVFAVGGISNARTQDLNSFFKSSYGPYWEERSGGKRIACAKKMKEIGDGLPVILTGDFNVDQTHKSYDVLVNKWTLCDSYEKCDIRYATNGTFNNFDPNSFTKSRIDHIFVSPDFHVKKYGVLTDTYRTSVNNENMQTNDCPSEIDIKDCQARVPSDHFPVVVELEVLR